MVCYTAGLYGFAWKDIEPNRIPWAALKSAWRRTSLVCLNCDRPTLHCPPSVLAQCLTKLTNRRLNDTVPGKIVFPNEHTGFCFRASQGKSELA
jgi:hypothetical protein